MGCKWSKIGATTKVVPVNESTDQPVAILNDTITGQQNAGVLGVIQKQPASNITDQPKQHNEQLVVDEVIDQSIPVALENPKPLLSDESRKHEQLALVRDGGNYPVSTSVDTSIQTFEQISTQKTADGQPSQEVNSNASNEHPVLINNQEEQNDNSNKETASIPIKSVVEENIDVMQDTTGDLVKRKGNDSIEEPTNSENFFSKRISSGGSAKDSLSSHNNLDQNDSIDDDIISTSDATISALPALANDHVEIVDADPEAFNSVFVKQRQDTIDNVIYRSTIESWKPTSLEQLREVIENFSKEKSLIECHWIIFYWITCNIEYDAVSYSNDNIPNQSVEEIFQTKKGVCASCSCLYKYLCNQLAITCEEVSGYAKDYGFDKCEEDAFLKKDHAWNAVQINHHWYLLDSAWGTRHLTQENTFKRELSSFYFLTRPQQMIYDHLPDDDKWQLLRTSINMTQYLQMPKIRPLYFDLNLELISPLHQAHVSLVREKSYALVLLRTPTDVDLSGDLKLNGEEIEGGHCIVLDTDKQLYRCYFAPASMGKHQVELFAKKINSTDKSYERVLDLTLNIDELPPNPVSYPTTWKRFYDFGLKLLSPVNTHLIKVCNDVTYAHVIIRAPSDVILTGSLKDKDGRKIEGGEEVYYDPRRSFWKCNFAPDRDGLFEAHIFAKKKSDDSHYSSVISFKVEASQVRSPPLSYPQTWQLFYDLNLKVIAPQNCFTVPWPENTSYVEIFIRAPDDVQLSSNIEYNNVIIKNGSLAQFDNEKMLWQLLFAPECIGEHDLVVFAKRISEDGTSGLVLKFHLNVTQLHRSVKFPTVYNKFHTGKCRIYEPLDGILKKGATVPIHYIIPGATEVDLQVDSNRVMTKGYHDPVLKQNITVGSKEVAVYAKYGQKSNYDGLVKYSVQ